MLLRLTANFPSHAQSVLAEVKERLPHLRGEPIWLSVKPQLTAHRGKLLSKTPGKGVAVHAASFIRLRRIVVAEELLSTSDIFRLIVAHELFHFAWVRLGNPLAAIVRLLTRRGNPSGSSGRNGGIGRGSKVAVARKLAGLRLRELL